MLSRPPAFMAAAHSALVAVGSCGFPDQGRHACGGSPRSAARDVVQLIRKGQGRHEQSLGPPPDDVILRALQEARRQKLDADTRMRLLVAYGRELAPPRPYRLADLAQAVGLSISGLRTAYSVANVEHAAGVAGHRRGRRRIGATPPRRRGVCPAHCRGRYSMTASTVTLAPGPRTGPGARASAEILNPTLRERTDRAARPTTTGGCPAPASASGCRRPVLLSARSTISTPEPARS
jgi:hypothetical protein